MSGPCPTGADYSDHPLCGATVPDGTSMPPAHTASTMPATGFPFDLLVTVALVALIVGLTLWGASNLRRVHRLVRRT